MKAYSVDLRQRVLAALDRGMPRSEVLTTFQVSLASLKRWHAARRDTGDFTPQHPSGGFEPTSTTNCAPKWPLIPMPPWPNTLHSGMLLTPARSASGRLAVPSACLD